MTSPSSLRRARRARVVAVALATGVALLAGCSTGSTPPPTKTVYKTVSPTDPGTGAATPTQSSAPTEPAQPTKVVKVTSLQSDGAKFGVGMPLVLYFSPPPTDSTAFTQAVTVTVDGQPANGAWYWEQPNADEKAHHVVEAHYRPEKYWPANSHIHVDIPIKGLSAGSTKKYDLVYSGKLTSLDYDIGDAHVSTINGAAKKMVVKNNGTVVKTFEISLGESKTPTYSGTKLVMQKGEDVPGTHKLRPNGTVHMQDTAHTYSLMVPWSVRITRSGEYIHAAAWNSQIGRTNTSDGCTNLFPEDAKWFYHFSRIGDVVIYSNTGGGQVSPLNGFGDWNVPWPTWQRGGLLLNH